MSNYKYTITSNSISSIQITAIGGGGGSDSGIGGNGGNGAIITVNFSVQENDVIYCYIGNGGDYGGSTTIETDSLCSCIQPVPAPDIITQFRANGRNGGKHCFLNNGVNDVGGGGGSITCVVLQRNNIYYVLIATGGGGGGSTTDGGNGGGVGGNVSIAGNSAANTNSDTTGGGGGIDGSLGQGGSGGLPGELSNSSTVFAVSIANDNSASSYGGGGGGGFGGGGGGGNIEATSSGGGGGSSYVNSDSMFSTFNTLFTGSPIQFLFPGSSGNGNGNGGTVTNGEPRRGNAGSVTITPNVDPDPTCFHTGTRILTVNGYIPVEELQKGDQVVTLKGPVEIKDMIKFTSNMKKHPLYILPKDILSPGVPEKDLYMSHNHAFKHKGLWHHMKCSPLTKEVYLEEIDYYHILIEDYFKYTILAENVEVETCFIYKEDDNMMIWSCNKLCCQPIKACRKIGQLTAVKIELPEVEPEAVPVPEVVTLTHTNMNNIERLMNKHFDPRRDTYQIKKNQVSQNKPKNAKTLQQKLESFMSQTQQIGVQVARRM